ncbi:hypothetical protein EDB85DRAFT_1892502 [Lactarius pseudohatsudake]|nr:hypothetical protein EDB85DRAFT_1892502 [Lactarius pseudohatsudake]
MGLTHGVHFNTTARSTCQWLPVHWWGVAVIVVVVVVYAKAYAIGRVTAATAELGVKSVGSNLSHTAHCGVCRRMGLSRVMRHSSGRSFPYHFSRRNQILTSVPDLTRMHQRKSQATLQVPTPGSALPRASPWPSPPPLAARGGKSCHDMACKIHYDTSPSCASPRQGLMTVHPDGSKKPTRLPCAPRHHHLPGALCNDDDGDDDAFRLPQHDSGDDDATGVLRQWQGDVKRKATTVRQSQPQGYNSIGEAKSTAWPRQRQRQNCSRGDDDDGAIARMVAILSASSVNTDKICANPQHYHNGYGVAAGTENQPRTCTRKNHLSTISSPARVTSMTMYSTIRLECLPCGYGYSTNPRTPTKPAINPPQPTSTCHPYPSKPIPPANGYGF